MAELVFKNYFNTDLRIFMQCVKKIDKTRFHKLMRCVGESINADCLHPDSIEENDKMFEPRTQAEKDLWEMYRALAKKDMRALQKACEAGKKGGRPPLTDSQKKDILEKATDSFVGKDKVRITDSFELPDNEYFNIYKKQFKKEEIEKAIRWIKNKKQNQVVDYKWIGKIIRDFRLNQTGKIF